MAIPSSSKFLSKAWPLRQRVNWWHSLPSSNIPWRLMGPTHRAAGGQRAGSYCRNIAAFTKNKWIGGGHFLGKRVLVWQAHRWPLHPAIHLLQKSHPPYRFPTHFCFACTNTSSSAHSETSSGRTAVHQSPALMSSGVQPCPTSSRKSTLEPLRPAFLYSPATEDPGHYLVPAFPFIRFCWAPTMCQAPCLSAVRTPQRGSCNWSLEWTHILVMSTNW